MAPENEMAELQQHIALIMEKAHQSGLNFFDMRFELCPPEVLYTFGSYGMPNRFSHWSFGKAYYRLKTQYDYNLCRIYELVVNSNPCYAFLLDGNSLIQNKLVAAHVLAHSDFFRNNFRFAETSRWMLESMATSARRIREYEHRYGRERVERFLDAVLSVQQHVEGIVRTRKGKNEKGFSKAKSTPYDDLWELGLSPKEAAPAAEKKPAVKKTVPASEYDLLGFIVHCAPELEDWQRDVVSILREEMLYFRPQMETKIMNEGWATFWHLRLLREIDLPQEEVLEFARMHASVIHPQPFGINPYLVGLKLFEDLEKRYGREKIFEVRETETDVSFLRNYLTRELVEELDLYLYRKVGLRWQVVEKDWEKVRDSLVNSLVNCGIPLIKVADGDFQRRGELLLTHQYEGLELDQHYAEKTLEHLYHIWGKAVHLDTVIDNRPQRLTFAGERAVRNAL